MRCVFISFEKRERRRRLGGTTDSLEVSAESLMPECDQQETPGRRGLTKPPLLLDSVVSCTLLAIIARQTSYM